MSKHSKQIDYVRYTSEPSSLSIWKIEPMGTYFHTNLPCAIDVYKLNFYNQK